jgi:hypothetical protein
MMLPVSMTPEKHVLVAARAAELSTRVGSAIGALHPDLMVLTRPAAGRIETGDDWRQLHVALSDAPTPVLIL